MFHLFNAHELYAPGLLWIVPASIHLFVLPNIGSQGGERGGQGLVSFPG